MLALVAPAVVIFASFALALSGTLSVRSPVYLYLAPVMVVGTAIELVAVPVAITRLLRFSNLRRFRSYALTAAGTLALAPGLLAYLLTISEGWS